MSLTRPLQSLGSRGRERESVLRKTREEVRARSGGRCEWPGCWLWGTDLCHGFGRGNMVGQPLCDHPKLCWWGCRDHHDAYDGRRPTSAMEQTQMLKLASEMVWRASEDFPDLACQLDSQPVDAVRWMERRLRETGIIRGREWAE